MRIAGDFSETEIGVYRDAVDQAADELCLRVGICIEAGLGVDDLVGVVTGESTPQVYPRDYFREVSPVRQAHRRIVGRTSPRTARRRYPPSWAR